MSFYCDLQEKSIVMLFRNAILSLFSIVLLLNTTSAQQTPSSSLLWKISGNGLKEPSYIFGTFHMMCKTDFSITPILEEKVKSTQQFFGELDMDDPTLQTTLMSSMRLKETNLQKLLGEDEFKIVSDSFKNITGISLQMFNQFSPFMSMSMLTLSSIACSDKIQPETEFVNIAKKNALPILGLETVQDQVNAINSQPLDSQAVSLKRTVLNYDSVKQVMIKMIEVYKEKNTDKLYQFIKDNSDGNDNFEQEMLVTRNVRWIPVIKKAVHEKPSFFAVGAGHLGGKQGVLNLLKEQGYTLTPVLY